jgi:hypothetical protein
MSRKHTNLWSNDKTKAPSPHILFGNAGDEESMTEFVKAFGPVVAERFDSSFQNSESEKDFSVLWGEVERDFPNFKTRADRDAFFRELERRTDIEPDNSFELRTAFQRWDELKSEQEVFRRMLCIVQAIGESRQLGLEAPTNATELNRLKEQEYMSLGLLAKFLEGLPNGTKNWLGQLEREREAAKPHGNGFMSEWGWDLNRQANLEEIASRANSGFSSLCKGTTRLALVFAGSEPGSLAEDAVSLILNAFPPRFRWIGDYAIEHPPDALSFGIRPLLFMMIRRQITFGREVR